MRPARLASRRVLADCAIVRQYLLGSRRLYPGKRRSAFGSPGRPTSRSLRSPSAGLRGDVPRRPHANGPASRVHGTLGSRVLTRPADRSRAPVPTRWRASADARGARLRRRGPLPAPPARRAWLRLMRAARLMRSGRILLVAKTRCWRAFLAVASSVMKPSSAQARISRAPPSRMPTPGPWANGASTRSPRMPSIGPRPPPTAHLSSPGNPALAEVAAVRFATGVRGRAMCRGPNPPRPAIRDAW